MSRSALTWLALAVLAAALVVIPVFNPSIIPSKLAHTVEDFGAYWCAAKVARAGGNPYDAETLRPLEAAIDPDRPEPIITWSPPWAISLVAPFTAFDFPVARWLWMLFQLVGIAGCAAVVWRFYAGRSDRVGIAWLLAFGFYPTLQLIALGQMSLFTLAAVGGFLTWVSRRPFLAGACLALVLVKPHNVIPFGVAVLIWITIQRHWRVLAGGVVAVTLWSVAALVIHPSFFSLYREAMTANPPGMMKSPTLGTILRIVLGADQSLWLQFVPTILGSVWAGWYATRNWKRWDWLTAAPALLFASVLCSPYGWVYDSVVLLIPILAVAARGVKYERFWLALYLGITLICVSLFAAKIEEVGFVWLPWILLMMWGGLSLGGSPLTPGPSPPRGEGNKIKP